MAGKDYYKILGISKTATDDEIKKAYRKLAMKYHPDRNKDDKNAEARFKDISEAYAVLSNKEKRVQYDNFGSEGFQKQYSQEDIFRNFDFDSIFSEFGFGGRGRGGFGNIFGGMGGNSFKGGASPFGGAFGGRPQPVKGKDIIYELSIGLEDTINDTEKMIAYRKDNSEQEKISVKIPAGISTGKKLRLSGKGNPGINGGPNGDLYIQVRVMDHPLFKRDGDDLTITKSIKFTEAALGTEIEVTTIDKKTLRLKIPAGTQNNAKLRLKGYGVPRMNGVDRGDAYVTISIEVPKNLTKKQEETIKKLAELGM
ncbi:MAG: DnaJ domain-containing protein [Desulfatiglans sp.]|jgi:curved DNA-binding protein|nr:DnaJ domain-containing protein [Desulfatiglans sp.]